VTENTAPDQDTTPEFNLDDWLAGATIAQASVDILQRPDLLARYDEWERRYERAQQIAKSNPDAGLDDEDPLLEIEAEGETLLAEISASRATWYVRGLQDDDANAINEAFPMPDKPAGFDKPLPTVADKPTNAQAEAYNRRFRAYEIELERYNTAHRDEHESWAKAAFEVQTNRGAEQIVRCLDRIEVAGRVIATSITHEQARALPSKIGDVQVGKIIAAIKAAREAEPEVPAGFLSRSSATSPE